MDPFQTHFPAVSGLFSAGLENEPKKTHLRRRLPRTGRKMERRVVFFVFVDIVLL